MRTTSIVLEVVHPDEVQPDQVAAAINKLLDVGLADAKDTADDRELDSTDARLALSLNIGQPLATAT